MLPQEILTEAAALQDELQAIRHDLHRHPETGFDLAYTKPYVRQKLEEMGYAPVDCGKAGLIALAGGKRPGRTILLRADMDALPIAEEAQVDFASLTPGKMHGCGHDMHTAMLLGAARLLKAHEGEIEGTVKLEFQPAEEIFQGSPDMLANGLLENPKVDAAAMLHVIAGVPMPNGMLQVATGGVSAASCEQYHITVRGKGGHGASPHLAVDPITAAAHIHLALQEISARELEGNEFGIFTTGRFAAGEVSNVIPDKAEMWGTIRTTDPGNAVGERIKKRMTEIANGVAAAMRCTAEVEFYDYCPCMYVDPDLGAAALGYMKELLGPAALDLNALTGGKAGGGSEDFSFVSHRVPTVTMFLAAGNADNGYRYAQHHPKVMFDDAVLSQGAAIHTWLALRWLAAHAAPTLDVGGVQSVQELHALLKEKLALPDFYGHNWDAFADAVSGLVQLPEKLRFTGWDKLAARLPKDSAVLKKILTEHYTRTAPDRAPGDCLPGMDV